MVCMSCSRVAERMKEELHLSLKIFIIFDYTPEEENAPSPTPSRAKEDINKHCHGNKIAQNPFLSATLQISKKRLLNKQTS